MSIDLVQRFDVELDSKKLLKKYLELAMATVFDSTEEIAVKIIDHNDEHKSLYYPSAIYGKNDILPIILIEGWYGSQDGAERSFFNGYKPWELFKGRTALKDAISHIMTFLDKNQSDLNNLFLEQSGDGYTYGFSPYDGTTKAGFKLMSNNTFPNSLSLSLTHIRYGK